VPSRLAFTGSKRQARAQAEVARVQQDLAGITALAPFIRDDTHLAEILADVEDADLRDAVRVLLTKVLTPPVIEPC
jgi:hypothetical protein